MRKRIFPPVLAAALGLAAALLRLWQRSTYSGGLPQAGHPSSILLPILCVLAGLYFLSAAFQVRTRIRKTPPPPGPARRVLLFLSAAAAALSLFSYLLQIFRALVSHQGLLSVFLECVLALAAIPTVLALLLLSNGPCPRRLEGYALLCPALYGWLWLIDVYRKHTANPVLWDYIFLLLCTICLLLASFYRAGFAFRLNRPHRAAFFSLCGVFLVPIALAGDRDIPSLCIALSLGLYALTVLLWPPVPLPPETEEPPLPDELAGNGSGPEADPEIEPESETETKTETKTEMETEVSSDE